MEFSTNSLTTEAGRSTTSPAAIRFAVCSSRRAIVFADVSSSGIVLSFLIAKARRSAKTRKGRSRSGVISVDARKRTYGIGYPWASVSGAVRYRTRSETIPELGSLALGVLLDPNRDESSGHDRATSSLGSSGKLSSSTENEKLSCISARHASVSTKSLAGIPLSRASQSARHSAGKCGPGCNDSEP